jgi:hypothetical protein
MHDHRRVTRGLVTELLQEFVEFVVVTLYARIGFGNKVLEQPRPLHKKKEELVDISFAMSTSVLTEFLILRVLSNEIRTLQCLLAYALDDGLHEFDISQFCLCEESIDPVHLRKERANGVVASRLVDNHLANTNQIVALGKYTTGEPWKQKKGWSMRLAHKGESMHRMSVQALLVQQNVRWRSCPRQN